MSEIGGVGRWELSLWKNTVYSNFNNLQSQLPAAPTPLETAPGRWPWEWRLGTSHPVLTEPRALALCLRSGWSEVLFPWISVHDGSSSLPHRVSLCSSLGHRVDCTCSRVLLTDSQGHCCLAYEWASYFMSKRVSELISAVCGGCDYFNGKASCPRRHTRGDLCKDKRKSCWESHHRVEDHLLFPTPL